MNMNFFKQNQTLIIVVALVVVAFVVYTFFFAGDSQAPVLDQTAVTQASPEDQNLISLLLELKSITLDDSIFKDPIFLGLQDFSQELVPEPSGRPNPFAPLDADRGRAAPPAR